MSETEKKTSWRCRWFGHNWEILDDRPWPCFWRQCTWCDKESFGVGGEHDEQTALMTLTLKRIKEFLERSAYCTDCKKWFHWDEEKDEHEDHAVSPRPNI